MYKHIYSLHNVLSRGLSPILAAIFPGEPGLAGFIAAKDDGSGGDNWSHMTCNPVKSSAPTNQFFTGQMPFLSPNQQHQSTEGNSSEVTDGISPARFTERIQLCSPAAFFGAPGRLMMISFAPIDLSRTTSFSRTAVCIRFTLLSCLHNHNHNHKNNL